MFSNVSHVCIRLFTFVCGSYKIDMELSILLTSKISYLGKEISYMYTHKQLWYTARMYISATQAYRQGQEEIFFQMQ